MYSIGQDRHGNIDLDNTHLLVVYNMYIYVHSIAEEILKILWIDGEFFENIVK